MYIATYVYITLSFVVIDNYINSYFKSIKKKRMSTKIESTRRIFSLFAENIAQGIALILELIIIYISAQNAMRTSHKY